MFYTFRSLKLCVKIHLSWCPLPHLSSVGGKIFFQKELFMRRTFEGNLWEGVALHGGVLIRSCKGRGSFIKAFFNNLNTLNLFPNYVGIFTWRWSPDQNYGMICRWVNSWERGFKDCVMLSFLHADSELGHWCIIWKVNTGNRMLNLKKAHCSLCFVSLFSILSDYLQLDALLTGLSQICSIIGQTLAESTI